MDCFSVLGFGKSVPEVADDDLVVAIDLLAHLLLSNVLSNNDLVVICLRNNNKRESLSVVVILRN